MKVIPIKHGHAIRRQRSLEAVADPVRFAETVMGVELKEWQKEWLRRNAKRRRPPHP